MRKVFGSTRFRNVAFLFCITIVLVAVIVAFMARGNIFTPTKGWLIIRGSMVGLLAVVFLFSVLGAALEMEVPENSKAKTD